MTVRLFAEVLQNIGTVSVLAELSTESNQDTKAAISDNGTKLDLTHNGETATLDFPVALAISSGDTTLAISASPTRNLSFRVPIKGRPKPGQTGQIESRPLVPWLARSLGERCEIGCKGCRSPVVQRGSITIWKDLPSEGWAEMMEFWHCHKPDEPHQHDQSGSRKGYAAGSVLKVERGVGLVDALEFLFDPNDCQNINTGPPRAFSPAVPQLLFCSQCSTALGTVDASTGGYKLRKPQLSISVHPKSPFMAYSSEKWMCARILAATESQGCRRFTIFDPGRTSSEVLKIWVFGLDVTTLCATSADMTTKQADTGATRAAKIFYKFATAQTDFVNGQTLNSGALTEGEIEMDLNELQELVEVLQQSSSLLPEKAKHFPPDWNMGLLRRFTEEDVSF